MIVIVLLSPRLLQLVTPNAPATSGLSIQSSTLFPRLPITHTADSAKPQSTVLDECSRRLPTRHGSNRMSCDTCNDSRNYSRIYTRNDLIHPYFVYRFDPTHHAWHSTPEARSLVRPTAPAGSGGQAFARPIAVIVHSTRSLQKPPSLCCAAWRLSNCYSTPCADGLRLRERGFGPQGSGIPSTL